ncbi:hypothetical protein BJV74DRAFT_146232 [Russula compacta]|nr:hypothetical protein BJV74DRAFT_146232 [Russula compacta]
MKIPSPVCFLSLSLFPLLASAYTWQFNSQPRQCQNVSLSVMGSGQPPYSLLIIPYGPTPLPNNTEVRTIENIPFPGNSNTLTFELNYPENSSFVAVVSDKSGIGSGGTSTPVTVLQSSSSSCYNASQPAQWAWVFNVDPSGGLTQCQSARLWWESIYVNGTVNFYGVIPGGTSFAIPQGSITTNNVTGTGFDWLVDITGGTNLLLVGSDDRGIGSGGSAPFTISYAQNSSCLNSNSPSSTAGSPAGGSYPTSTSDSSTSNSGSHSNINNTGAIVGGVVGAAIFLFAAAMVVFYVLRRRPYSSISKQRPVNVLQDDEDGNDSNPDLPHYYTPEPFLVPDPTIIGTSEAASTQGRPLSMTTADIRPQTPTSATTTTTRKSAAPPQLRPVNIVQHDDAGPSEYTAGHGEPETIELPPAYSNIRPLQRSPLAASSTSRAEDDP